MLLSDPLTNESFVPKRLAKAPYDKILDANRNILIRIIGEEDDRIVSKDYLLGAGFNFQIFNRSFEKDGVQYQCVYRYALCLLKSGQYKIIKLK